LDVAGSPERFSSQRVIVRQDSGALQSRRDGLAEHFASRRRAVDEAFSGELTRGGEFFDDAAWSQLRESHQETDPACARALRGLEMKTRLTIGNSFVRTGI
jgi:hypothetical protein